MYHIMVRGQGLFRKEITRSQWVKLDIWAFNFKQQPAVRRVKEGGKTDDGGYDIIGIIL